MSQQESETSIFHTVIRDSCYAAERLDKKGVEIDSQLHNIMSSHEASTRTSLGNIERGMGKIHGAIAALLYVMRKKIR